MQYESKPLGGQRVERSIPIKLEDIDEIPSCYEGSSKIKVEVVSEENIHHLEEVKENELKGAVSAASNDPASPFNIIARPPDKLYGAGFPYQ